MKVAAVQMDVVFADAEANLEKMTGLLQETTSNGAVLTVFPECCVCGYCFESFDEARDNAQTIPGPATERMSEACAALGGYAIFGMLEHDGDKIFNVAVLVGGKGVIGCYRKVHLPYLGVDKFTTPGDRPFAAHDAGGLQVGMNICYDVAFPEAARLLSLAGADLIVLPTAWPPGAECVASYSINTRALENGVYYMAVNRVGWERGYGFLGRSRICDPGGRTMAESLGFSEEILYAEIDPARARRKHVIRIPGEHEIDRMADRRPEMYGPIVEPHNLKPPGRG